MWPLRRDDAWMIGLPARSASSHRPREASRSDGFALAAVDAAPDRTVHAIEGDQATRPASQTATLILIFMSLAWLIALE